MAFYNTIKLDKEILKNEMRKAQKLEEKILAVFMATYEIDLTPTEVYFTLNEYYPITSVRRAITDLTSEKKGKLVKTDNQREGMYGKPNYCWKLK